MYQKWQYHRNERRYLCRRRVRHFYRWLIVGIDASVYNTNWNGQWSKSNGFVHLATKFCEMHMWLLNAHTNHIIHQKRNARTKLAHFVEELYQSMLLSCNICAIFMHKFGYIINTKNAHNKQWKIDFFHKMWFNLIKSWKQSIVNILTQLVYSNNSFEMDLPFSLSKIQFVFLKSCNFLQDKNAFLQL